MAPTDTDACCREAGGTESQGGDHPVSELLSLACHSRQKQTHRTVEKI